MKIVPLFVPAHSVGVWFWSEYNNSQYIHIHRIAAGLVTEIQNYCLVNISVQNGWETYINVTALIKLAHRE